MSPERDKDAYALREAVTRHDAEFVGDLIPQVARPALTAALADLVECASMLGRRCHIGIRSAVDITDRTARLRAIAAALLSADADMPVVSRSEDDLVDGIARHAASIAVVVPAAGVVGWVWSHQIGADCAYYPAIMAYAEGQPLGLDDAVTAGWAARRAAEHADEAWSMRLLGALGAAT